MCKIYNFEYITHKKFKGLNEMTIKGKHLHPFSYTYIWEQSLFGIFIKKNEDRTNNEPCLILAISNNHLCV